MACSRIERFWAKVKKGDGCWEWQGARYSSGHGAFRWGPRVVSASRAAWTLQNGDPGELWVLHHCDNPSCVRLEHLYLGCPSDNSRDMVRRGRSAKGSQHSQAKLTEEEVWEIRTAYGLGIRVTDLARAYGVSQSHMSNIVAGKLWRHIG